MKSFVRSALIGLSLLSYTLGSVADVKISALPAAAAPTGNEIVPVTQNLSTTVGMLLSTIRDWLFPNYVDLCSYSGVDPQGSTDSRTGVVNAMAAVSGTSKVLKADNCTIKIAIGYDGTKPIFVPSNLTLKMGPGSKFVIDNSAVPGFVLNNATGVRWDDVQIQFVGAAPQDNSVQPYAGQPGYSFNDGVCKADLIAHSGMTLTNGGSCIWTGPGNASAVISVKGGSNNQFNRLKVFVAPGTTADKFIPTVVALDPQWLPNTTVSNNSQPETASTANGPTNTSFTDCQFDGFWMGYTGFSGSVAIKGQQFFRYSDLQDESYLTNGTGGNQGGSSNTGSGFQWFPPPHAIYLQSGDASFKAHYIIQNVIDWGQYVGGTLRRPMSSGTLLSLKVDLGGGTVVDDYVSYRPDGWSDTLSNYAGTQGGTMKNVYVQYDSSVTGIDGGHPWGWRFPSSNAYTKQTFSNITLVDTAVAPTAYPILGPGLSTNQDLSFTGIKVYLNDWPLTAGWIPSATYSGTNINVELEDHFVQSNSTSTYKGVAQNNGNGVCVNCSFEVKVFGWRQPTVTLSAPPAAGATGVTLQTAWPYTTGNNYSITFSDGTVRYTSFTNGSTAIGSFAALPAGVTATATIGNMLTANLESYKSATRVNTAGGSFYSHVHVIDVSNGYDALEESGLLNETWTQFYQGTPVGNTTTGFVSPIAFPNTFSETGWALINNSALTGATGINVGWNGNYTALASNLSVANGYNHAGPLAAPLAFPSNPTAIVLQPIGASFGTGVVTLSVRGARITGGN